MPLKGFCSLENIARFVGGSARQTVRRLPVNPVRFGG